MMTYFHDFIRDNGTPVTVEYAVDGCYTPTTYSPMYGADGGDAPTFLILKAWPKTPWHERLAWAHLSLRYGRKTRLGVLAAKVLSWPVYALMRFHEWWRASLTDAERERFEEWLAEHHEDDPYEPDWER